MSSFLSDVASALYSEYGVALSEFDVVFASRRAERYFKKELAKLGVANPSYYSIDGWIEMQSKDVKKADNFTLLTNLYLAYNKHYSDESFDEFYSFGKLLLSDFNLVDRYLVDAKSLYSVLGDTRAIESNADDPAKEAGVRFWALFKEGEAKRHKQQEFLRIWESLHSVYEQFRWELSQKSIAYSGMIYRSVAENFDAAKYARKVIFVGLNALSSSEKLILSKLRDTQLADFFWDYNPQWLEGDESESAHFISLNIKEFAQATYFKTSTDSHQDIDIEIIETPSDVVQCKAVTTILERLLHSQNGVIDNETAIVLTDENLLLPLLHSIPSAITSINISIGYPLKSTPAYNFIESLINLQNRAKLIGEVAFYHEDVKSLLNNPYLANLERIEAFNSLANSIVWQNLYIPASELDGIAYADLWRSVGGGYSELHRYITDCLSIIKSDITDSRELFFVEQSIKTLNYIQSIIERSAIKLSRSIYLALLRETFSEQSIDFEGHSGDGLQIMGILESRSLDFRNVILLSLTDDNFPSSKPTSSYIPQILKQGYGMPTVADQSAIWSYYFYRLLQRPTNATLIYCSVADNSGTGEQSRYLSQLELGSGYDVRRTRMGVERLKLAQVDDIAIEKTEQVIELLKDKSYSPHSLARYLNCPLSFYFADIAKILSPKSVDDSVSSADVGNIFHKTMQTLYCQIVGLDDARQYIKQISTDKIIKTISTVMKTELGDRANARSSALDLIYLTVQTMVETVVAFDAQSPDSYVIESLEKTVEGSIGMMKVRGVVDRIDRLDDGSMRIIDYKSGSDANKLKSFDDLIDADPTYQRKSILQLLLYCVVVGKKYNTIVAPRLYVARKMRVRKGRNTDIAPMISCGDVVIERLTVEQIAEIERIINSLYSEICSSQCAFAQSAYTQKACIYCDYKPICRKL